MKGDASLTDLRVEDKLKIGNMLKELAKAQREGQQAARERQEYQSRLNKLRGQNETIIKVSIRSALSNRAPRSRPRSLHYLLPLVRDELS